LLSYSSKGRRELPNTRVLLDGDLEPLSRDGSFSAQHILTPKPGVAIHINAFNFPCRGTLEKLAPTWLAGMPAIIKPASQTAQLTELVVRKIDRKSTRLNSSHVAISYAVFCLKKKKKDI